MQNLIVTAALPSRLGALCPLDQVSERQGRGTTTRVPTHGTALAGPTLPLPSPKVTLTIALGPASVPLVPRQHSGGRPPPEQVRPNQTQAAEKRRRRPPPCTVRVPAPHPRQPPPRPQPRARWWSSHKL